MQFRNVLTGIALIVATAAITTQVVSQDVKPGAGQPPMSAEEQEYMKKWQEFATPNEHHSVLAAKVGKWEGTVKMWMDPNAPPSVTSGTSEMEMGMDGRYLFDHTSGQTPFGPFEGMGVTGYDNLKKKYVYGWIDNMSTGLMTGEGTYDAKAKTFTFTGESPDVATGKYVKSRTIERWIDADTWVMESHTPGPDGKEFKSMEITYKRAK